VHDILLSYAEMARRGSKVRRCRELFRTETEEQFHNLLRQQVPSVLPVKATREGALVPFLGRQTTKSTVSRCLTHALPRFVAFLTLTTA